MLHWSWKQVDGDGCMMIVMSSTIMDPYYHSSITRDGFAETA
jgi:hypothetical protein